jgi:uncharacterized repeat protein (TIGR03803 family)
VWSNVVMDARGNLYGTTSGGGAYGYGTVFELSPGSGGTWTETVLHSFMKNDPDGEEPMASVILDGLGNLYGGTPIGGKYHVGAVFELSPGSGGWALTLLHSMGAYKGDAQGFRGSLIMDAKGNLYGAAGGGTPGAGAIYELSPGSDGWTEKVIYDFGLNKGANGNFPAGTLIFDSLGDIYGATYIGGDLSCGDGGCGLVYKLSPSASGWQETILHSFTGPPSDGSTPGTEQLAFDSKGNLYGTTLSGAGTGCNANTGCGSVFRLTRGSSGWKETLVHKFGNGENGYTPVGVTFDKLGNAYGVAEYGGSGCGCGVVFKLVPGTNGRWTYSVVHTFEGTDGAQPEGGLIIDASGNLYGTAVLGGSGGAGVVYEITP